MQCSTFGKSNKYDERIFAQTMAGVMEPLVVAHSILACSPSICRSTKLIKEYSRVKLCNAANSVKSMLVAGSANVANWREITGSEKNLRATRWTFRCSDARHSERAMCAHNFALRLSGCAMPSKM